MADVTHHVLSLGTGNDDLRSDLGPHLNPAVSLVMATRGELGWREPALFVLVQLGAGGTEAESDVVALRGILFF